MASKSQIPRPISRQNISTPSPNKSDTTFASISSIRSSSSRSKKITPSPKKLKPPNNLTEAHFEAISDSNKKALIEIKELKEKLELAETEISRSQKQISILEAENTDLKNFAPKLEENNKEKSNDETASKLDHSDSERRMISLLNDSNEKYQQRINEQSEKLKLLEIELKEKSDYVLLLNSENEYLKSEISKKPSSGSRENPNLTNINTSKTTKSAPRKDSLNQDELQSKITQLQSELNHEKQCRDAFEKDNIELHSKLNMLNEAKKRVELNNNTEIESNMSQEILEEYKMKAMHFETLFTNLKTENEKLETHNSNLKSRLQEMTLWRMNIEVYVTRLEKVIEGWNNVKNELEDKIRAEIQSEFEEKNKIVPVWKRPFEDAEHDILVSKVNELTLEVATKQEKIDSLQNNLPPSNKQTLIQSEEDAYKRIAYLEKEFANVVAMYEQRINNLHQENQNYEISLKDEKLNESSVEMLKNYTFAIKSLGEAEYKIEVLEKKLLTEQQKQNESLHEVKKPCETKNMSTSTDLLPRKDAHNQTEGGRSLVNQSSMTDYHDNIKDECISNLSSVIRVSESLRQAMYTTIFSLTESFINRPNPFPFSSSILTPFEDSFSDFDPEKRDLLKRQTIDRWPTWKVFDQFDFLSLNLHNNNDVWKDLESKLNIQDSSFSISMTLTQMEEHFQKFSVIIQELQTFFVRYVQHVDEAFSTLNWLRHKEIEYLNNEIIKSRSEHDKISEGLGVRINELQFELQKETEMRLAIEAVLDNSMLNFSDSDFHDEKQKWKRMASMWEKRALIRERDFELLVKDRISALSGNNQGEVEMWKRKYFDLVRARDAEMIELQKEISLLLESLDQLRKQGFVI